MALRWDPKDPNEVLDFDIDWSPRLVTGDTIAASVWAISGPDGSLTEDSNAFSGTATKIWLSGGTVTAQGSYYQLRNRVTTAAGRVMDQTVRLAIREK
jgi:hypothetical protein